MIKKTLEISSDVFIFSLIVGIALTAFVAVGSLSPLVAEKYGYTRDEVTTAEDVLGDGKSQQIAYQNLLSIPSKLNLNMNGGEVIISPTQLAAFEEYDLLKISNNSESSRRINFSYEDINGSKDLLDIYLVSGENEYLVKNNSVSIDVGAKSETTIKLKLVAESPINYPISFKIEFSEVNSI